MSLRILTVLVLFTSSFSFYGCGQKGQNRLTNSVLAKYGVSSIEKSGFKKKHVEHLDGDSFAVLWDGVSEKAVNGWVNSNSVNKQSVFGESSIAREARRLFSGQVPAPESSRIIELEKGNKLSGVYFIGSNQLYIKYLSTGGR